MEPFTRLTAVAAPIDLVNVDTDRIVPARFLKKPRDAGFGPFFFHDLRLADDGRPRPEFVLNQAPYRTARILVTAENFGCGSSREAAVWALADAGFRAVVGPSFGDIFAENCAKNGVVAAVLPPPVVADLRRQLHERPGATVTVDLERQVVTGPDGREHGFDVDPFRKECLQKGLDEIALTVQHEAAIAAHEARREAARPWLRR